VRSPAHRAQRTLAIVISLADLGITPEPREDHASYIAHWLGVLKQDKRAIFQAAAHAQRAVDFLHSLQPAAQIAATEAAGDSGGAP
jgi:antirestriction protein ArdC